MSEKPKANVYINPNAAPAIRDILEEVFPDANRVSAEEMRDAFENAPRPDDKKLGATTMKTKKVFRKFDGFMVNGWDDEMHPDDDGDSLVEGTTCELMHDAVVRVPIPPETSAADAIRLLRKVIVCIERDGLALPWE